MSEPRVLDQQSDHDPNPDPDLDLDVILTSVEWDGNESLEIFRERIIKRLRQVVPRLKPTGSLLLRILPPHQCMQIALWLGETNFVMEPAAIDLQPDLQPDSVTLTQVDMVTWLKTDPQYPASHNRNHPFHWATLLQKNRNHQTDHRDRHDIQHRYAQMYDSDSDLYHSTPQPDESKYATTTASLNAMPPPGPLYMLRHHSVSEQILVFARCQAQLHTNARMIGVNRRGQAVYQTPENILYSPAYEMDDETKNHLPRDLCQQLLRFYCPPHGRVSDPFASLYSSYVALACAEITADQSNLYGELEPVFVPLFE